MTNKQPYYHMSQFRRELTEEEAKKVIQAISKTKTVLKDRVELMFGELLFTATNDVSNIANKKINDILGEGVQIGEVDAEAGDPADLM